MKKLYKIMLLGLCLALVLTGCAGKSATPNSGNNGKKLKIVTTIFPEYDWVKNIMGNKFKDAEVTLLLNKGTDIHNYQPTVQDMMKVADCDVFIYVGGESDFWVEKALKESKNKNMRVLNLLKVLGKRVKNEEVVEGMQVKQEAGPKHEAEHKHEEAPEQDEHVWLSLRNAQVICRAIAQTLEEVDEVNKATYEQNLKAYEQQLMNLDREYNTMTKSAKQKTVLFGDRFPFRYLMDDYGIKYYAAFVGCSAETEASFQTISFLAKKVEALKLKTIFALEHSDQKIAKTIAAAAKDKAPRKVLTLNSMQATGSKEIEGGATYLNIMRQNLTVLQEALQ